MSSQQQLGFASVAATGHSTAGEQPMSAQNESSSHETANSSTTVATLAFLALDINARRARRGRVVASSNSNQTWGTTTFKTHFRENLAMAPVVCPNERSQ
ncbi:hypothetical protein BC835DRAFT_1418297 [Cytidiella melzeri]|nr:hypothetical protein BC835DRAFT_1418297 [Cytidiella melzeri]